MKVTYDLHPAAEIFPMMSDEEYAGLKADIQANGLREPMTVWKGLLIDGRNRLKACEELKIEGDFQELMDETDPVKWVISHNLHRRHLSTSQRAMVAAKLRGVFDDEAAKRKADNGKVAGNGQKKEVAKSPPPKSKARDDAGSALNVGGKAVDAATTVLKKGSKELIAKVESGEVKVSKAAKVAKEVPKAQQVKAATEKPAPKPKDEPDYFTQLRKVFDAMPPAQRLIAVDMWQGWIDETT